MGNLGKLWFDIGMNDMTDSDLERIKKKIKGNLKKVDVHLDIDIEAAQATDQIKKALTQSPFTARLGFSYQDGLNEVQSKLRGKEIKARIDFKNDFVSTIDNAFANHKFKIEVLVDKAEASRAVQDALAKIGYSPDVSANDIRAKRYEEVQNRINRANERAAEAQQRAYTRQQQMQVSLQRAQASAQQAMERGNLSIERQRAALRRAQLSAENYNKRLSGIMGNMNRFGGVAADLRRQLAGVFGIIGMERFLQSVIEIGGEFQKQRIALRTMYNEFDADVLYGQIKRLSVISPFEFKELISYTKQLGAFNIEYDQIYETTKRLADISAGLGVDMSRIILAYGQIRAASYLRGGELKQLTEAGVPVLDKLAEKLTQLNGRLMTTGDVMDAISRREISFEAVKDVLWEMTDEGGKFYKMQEELSASLAGKLSNLKDAYDIMLSAVADGNNKDLGGMLDMLTSLLENWELIAKVTMTAIKAVGSYAVACVVVTPIANSVKALSKAWRAVEVAERAAAISGTKFNKVFYALGVLIRKHPVGLLATAFAGLAVAVMSLKKGGDELQETFNKIADEVAGLKDGFDKVAENEKLIDKYEELKNKTERTKEETGQLNIITLQLQETFSGAAESVDEYGTAISMSVEKMRELTTEQKKALKANAADNIEEAAKGLSEIEKRIEWAKKRINHLKTRKNNGQWVKGRDDGFMKAAEKRLNDLLIQQIKAQAAIDEARKKMAAMGEDNAPKEESLSKWQQLAREARKVSNIVPEVKESSTITGYLEDITKAMEGLEKENKSLNQENEFTKGIHDKNKKDLAVLADLYNRLGGARKEAESGSKSDPEAERLKEEINLVKEAYGEYQKYLKEVGKAKAVEIVRADNRFANLNFDPDKYVETLSGLQRKIDRAGIPAKSRTSLSNTVSKLIFGANYEEVKRNIADTVERAKKEIDSASKQWGLFGELYDITGDKGKSFQLAFGKEMAPGIEDEIDGMKSVLKEKFGKSYEELADYSKEKLLSLFGTESEAIKDILDRIKELTDASHSDILKGALRLVAEYSSTEEKIAALEKKRDNEISKLRKSKGYGLLGEEDKLKAEEAVIKSYGKQITELGSESVKLSDVWQKLFGDTVNMGYRTLKKAAGEARRMVDEAKEYKDPKTGDTKMSLTWKDEAGAIHTANVEMTTYLQLVRKVADTEKSLAETDPFSAILEDLKRLNKAVREGDKDGQSNLLKKISNDAAVACGQIREAGNAFSGMFDAFGNEGLADKLGLAGDLLGEVGSLAQGLSSGNILQAAKSALTFIPGIIGKIAGFHDKKLDRAIQKSQDEVRRLQNAYKNLESEMERTLGEMAEQTYSAQISNLKRQQEQIALQIAKEGKKKKSDNGKIEDYKQQIKELDDQIRYFAEDTAKSLYGIDLKDWAGKFSDSIVDAWKKGEDAAVAFEKTASEILANVANEALKMAVIEPLFEDLRKKLPGIMSDGKIDEAEIGSIAESLLKVKDGYDSALGYLDKLSEKVYQMTNGEINLKDTLSTDTGTSTSTQGGIQASEQTMQLANSYLNAIRQDISVLRSKAEAVLSDSVLQNISIVGEAQLQQLNAIASNTASNAKSARIIQDALDSVITTGNGGKAVRIK